MLTARVGMGRSGRPSFPSIKEKGDTEQGVKARVAHAESFFVDSLDQFREQVGADKFTAMGHSIGGYLMSAYAIKHPERVNKLILVSPVGVPESPYAPSYVKHSAAKPSKPAQDKKTEGKDPPAELALATPDAMQPDSRPQAPVTWWSRLWEANVSPFTILRASTFLGPAVISRYGQRRFSTFEADVQQDLFAYLYGISRDRGSGEYCLAHLLAPRAYARWPLLQRLPQLSTPITLIYGDHDWMDEKGGYDLIKALKAKTDPASKEQRQKSKVVINEYSGHWTHLLVLTVSHVYS